MTAARRISIENKTSKPRTAFNGPMPEIGGNNFFTGEYDEEGITGINGGDPRDWQFFWQRHLKTDPPGDLPLGARALMIAEHHEGDPVEFEPESVVLDDGGLTVNWKRVHTASPEKPGGKSRFAVLLVPGNSDSQYYRDVFPHGEICRGLRQIAEEARVFTEGSRTDITIMPITKLRRKVEFSRG